MHHNYYRERRRQIEKDYQLQLSLLREEAKEVEWLEEEIGDLAQDNTILFQYNFYNIQILAPMNISKVIGPFTGALVFKNAEGQIQPFSGLTGVTLSVNDATIGTATLNADGTFGGTGLKAGDLILTAEGVNDAGAKVSGTSTITFHADTTVTEVDVNVN